MRYYSKLNIENIPQSFSLLQAWVNFYMYYLDLNDISNMKHKSDVRERKNESLTESKNMLAANILNSDKTGLMETSGKHKQDKKKTYHTSSPKIQITCKYKFKDTYLFSLPIHDVLVNKF